MSASDPRTRFGMDRSTTLGKLKLTAVIPYNTPGLARLDNTHYLPCNVSDQLIAAVNLLRGRDI